MVVLLGLSMHVYTPPEEVPLVSTVEQQHQILVLGMHHSATSIVSRSVILMNAYGGTLDDFILDVCQSTPCSVDKAHALKYWEQKDVVELNSRICINENPLGIVRGYDWTNWGLDIKALDPDVRQRFEADARAIVEKYHNMSNVITLKDPRMATLMPWWRPMFTNPVCLLVYRHPIFVARGLYKNHIELSFGDWLQLWENSTVNMLRGCMSARIVLTKQSNLLRDSFAFYTNLYESLVRVGVPADQLIRPERALFEEYIPPPPARLKYQDVSFTSREIASLSARAKRIVALFESSRDGDEFKRGLLPSVLEEHDEDIAAELSFHFFLLPPFNQQPCQLSARQEVALEASLLHHPRSELRLYVPHLSVHKPLLNMAPIDRLRSVGYRVTLVDDSLLATSLVGTLAEIGRTAGVSRRTADWLTSDLLKYEGDLVIKLLTLYRDGGVVGDLDLILTRSVAGEGDMIFHPYAPGSWMSGIFQPTLLKFKARAPFVREWLKRLIVDYEDSARPFRYAGDTYRHVSTIAAGPLGESVTISSERFVRYDLTDARDCMSPRNMTGSSAWSHIWWSEASRAQFVGEAVVLSLFDDMSWRMSFGDLTAWCHPFLNSSVIFRETYQRASRAPLLALKASPDEGVQPTLTWTRPPGWRDPFAGWRVLTMQQPRCAASRPWSRPGHTAWARDRQAAPDTFFLIWAPPEPAEGDKSPAFPPWRHRIIEALLRHHPGASVRVLSNVLPHETFKKLSAAGHDVRVVPLDPAALLANTPLEEVWRWAWSWMPTLSPHAVEAARLALLWKYGGVYIDANMLVLRPLVGLRNTLGYAPAPVNASSGAEMVSSALFAFDRGHPFIALVIQRFAELYDAERWPAIGPSLLSLALDFWRERAQHLCLDRLVSPAAAAYLDPDLVDRDSASAVQVLAPQVLFPLAPQDAALTSARANATNAKVDALRTRLETPDVYTLPLWSQKERGWHNPPPHSFVSELLEAQCLDC